MSTKIHPLQFSLENGKQTLPYTNAEVAKILIVYIFFFFMSRWHWR